MNDAVARSVGLDELPVATLISRGGRVVAVNAAYETLMAVRAEEVLGQSIDDLTRRFVTAPHVPMVDRAATEHLEGRSPEGHLWCTVVDGSGLHRALRVLWRPSPDDPELGLIYLLDDEGEALAKMHAEALARAGGALVRCRDEGEVLERAVDALHAQGFTATVLLIREGDPLLALGPTRTSVPDQRRTKNTIGVDLLQIRPPRAILEKFNPRFHEGRAAYFQDLDPLLDGAYERNVADAVKQAQPGRRVVQAPLFVDREAYGALVVTSDALTPALAGAIEIFAELMARAIENVRLHQRAQDRLRELERLQGELVERERLVALGEAAAVMAHEVRNPVGSILNAVTLLRRGQGEATDLLSVIVEEAQSLDRIVTDLLTLGRPLSPRVAATELGCLCERAAAMLRSRGGTPIREIVVRRPPQPTWASLDPELAILAVCNVLRNAVQASPETSVVEVSVAREGDAVAIQIDDQGPGIPRELARKILEPFFTTRPAGTGVGLAVVRRFVEACAGRVEIAATERGGGRVRLWFAACEP